MLSADDAVPYDRPNLSKDYLAGQGARGLDPAAFGGLLQGEGDRPAAGSARGSDRHEQAARCNWRTAARQAFDALLLATGAHPVRLDTPGADLPHVHYLRTLDDSRAIIAKAESAKRVAVIGASFIGLETAAALRERGLEVHVIGPQARPLERVLGPELGDMIKAIHEEHGVMFHLGTSAVAIERDAVTLKNGERIAADLVVAGIGVRPEVEIAAQAGIAVDNGVIVDAYLETNVPGIFAAGDIARWPDPHSGGKIRVEHWVVAERQGQTAAQQHSRPGRAVRCRPVLLEPALRSRRLLCRPRRALGPGRDRRRPCEARLQGDLLFR